MTKNNHSPGRLVTIAEAAEVLGCSHRTVWRLIRTRQLTAVRFLRVTRISTADLERFVDRAARRGRDARISQSNQQAF